MTLKPYYLRNTFRKAVPATGSALPLTDQSKVNSKPHGFPIPGAIKNICESWEKDKRSTLTGVWKKLAPTVMDDFEEFKTQGRK